jgi:YidC/Oxa1 family membrane protein insertase
MNQKIAEVYQTNQINPLAGCIPALVQIPIFIGLYRAVLDLAKEDRLDERFLWLPNLEGPIYGADPAHGSDWLLKNWNNGIPPLGWEDTLAFLSLPVILIVSQYVSMALMTPTMNKDQEQPAILKFLPLMVGWFSLNVPAALGIYWVVNNVVTTLLTLQIRSSLVSATTTSSGGSATIVDVEPIKFTPAPIREKPVGFRTETSKKGEGDMKMITSPTDESDDDEEDGEDTVESSTTDSDGAKSKVSNRTRLFFLKG